MSAFTTLTSADGFSFPAYVARPEGAPRGALVVLQEIFGVNSHIRSVADRWAARGYLVVAPATFSRVQKDVELGYTGDDMKAGIALKAQKRCPRPACCPTSRPPSTMRPRNPAASRSASSASAGVVC